MAPYVLLIWLSLLFWPLYLIFKKKKQTMKLPPSPSRLPILGNFHLLSRLLHQSYWQLSKKYGPFVLV
ncbi:Cytochrome P450 71A4 [Euphorbia peplus]|nr:Cytochrome P450 71A4 [Euphorbia peplus]